MTKEEILAKIEALEKQANDFKNEEQAIKLTLNSIYGACGNKWFSLFNLDVAEAVTLQGQDLIKYAEMVVNRYFREYWEKDYELHKILDIRNVTRVNDDLSVYGDTDSQYIRFDAVIQSCEFDYSPLEFILKLNEHRLNGYLKKCFDIYADKSGTPNNQDFELENISRNGIFLGKKKYVLNLSWESPGIYVEDLTKIKPTGVEIAQGGTPPFAREKTKMFLKYIFEHGKNLNMRELIKILRKTKEEFKIQQPEMISTGTQISDYDKYVLGDTKELILALKCPAHVRASGHYNLLLNNSKLKTKYSLIRSQEKIRWYYAKTKQNDPEGKFNVFAHPQGVFPVEFAPPIDYDAQFNKVILDPINRFIEAMGFNPLTPGLVLINVLV